MCSDLIVCFLHDTPPPEIYACLHPLARLDALPISARAVNVGWRASIALALASLGRLILGNLVALPFYILLLVTGIGTLLLALAVNALLLGRDLEAMVLARHPDRPRLGRAARWSLGLLSAAAFLIPVANFLAPIVGAAMAVHMLHLGRTNHDPT